MNHYRAGLVSIMLKELHKNDYSSVSVDFLTHAAGPNGHTEGLSPSGLNNELREKFACSETSNFSLANLIDSLPATILPTSLPVTTLIRASDS